MRLPARKIRGYSLIEILVVLSILGILAVVGVSVIGNRKGAAVRSLMDEMEGALTNARATASATGRDITIETWGTWTPGANALVMAYGDNSLLPNTQHADDQLNATATKLLAGQVADPKIAYSQTVAVPFRFLPNDGTQSRACIVVAGTNDGDWGSAMKATSSGATNADITKVDPFVSGKVPPDLMDGCVVPGNNLFATAKNFVVISGSTYRFNTTFIIQIVGTSPSSGAIPGSPMGIIVGLNNGSSVYKFYNPGVLEGDGKWRRI